MLRVNILKACLPALCAVAAVLSTLAQSTQLPAPGALEPTPTPTPTANANTRADTDGGS